MNTEVNLFCVPWTRILFPFHLNCVLENILVCVQFISNEQMIPNVYILLCSYLYFWKTVISFHLLYPSCALVVFMNYISNRAFVKFDVIDVLLYT